MHKRIGVEPKFYLSAVYLLHSLLVKNISAAMEGSAERRRALLALDKLIYFDVTLVFETYILSLVSEIEAVKNRTEEYARALEETVAMRNGQLRTDVLTGLTTRRYLNEALHRTVKAAQRRKEPVALTRGWDNHGLWLTMNGFMAGRGILMGWVLWRRRLRQA